ncbi:MAG: hypothetical protein Kow0075_08930 [Salibacteraceae bacterium]
MKSVWSIFKFVFMDNLKSTWAIAYTLLLAVMSYALIYFTGSFTRSVVSIMNVVILVAPLVATMMTSMYYYNKADFIYLVLTQPVSRSQAFLGIYLGLAVMLFLSILLGLGGGILAGISHVENPALMSTLIGLGAMLSLVFSALAMFISVASNDKLKGIGLALFIWLFMAAIYDGLTLMYFIAFSEYPIEEHAIALSLLNPIDLCRIFIMLQLDISALMGYSGAVFQKFFGTGKGLLISSGALFTWVLLPIIGLMIKADKKDF